MSKRLKITIGSIPFEAELHEKVAPNTCKAIQEILPIHGKIIQARWSGEAAWLPMDLWGIEVPFENVTSHPSRGDLLYYSGEISEKELLISYGSTLFSSKVGQLQGNHFASIVEGIERLEEMGRKILWEGAQEITIETKK
jgi:hypothetical protein